MLVPRIFPCRPIDIADGLEATSVNREWASRRPITVEVTPRLGQVNAAASQAKLPTSPESPVLMQANSYQTLVNLLGACPTVYRDCNNHPRRLADAARSSTSVLPESGNATRPIAAIEGPLWFSERFDDLILPPSTE